MGDSLQNKKRKFGEQKAKVGGFPHSEQKANKRRRKSEGVPAAAKLCFDENMRFNNSASASAVTLRSALPWRTGGGRGGHWLTGRQSCARLLVPLCSG